MFVARPTPVFVIGLVEAFNVPSAKSVSCECVATGGADVASPYDPITLVVETGGEVVELPATKLLALVLGSMNIPLKIALGPPVRVNVNNTFPCTL